MIADVVVIGAGLAGLSTAWHLAASNRVIVVDQAAHPGAEASSQNAGLVRRLIEDPYERLLAIRASRFYAEPGDDWAGLHCSRVTGAVLGLAHDPYYLHDAVAHGRAMGVVVEACDRPAEVAPALAGAALQHVWYLPGERVADSQALLTGLLRGLTRMAAEVRCGTKVTGLLIAGGRVTGVQTDAGNIKAGKVVLAAGAWSGTLAARIGLSRPLFALRRTIVYSAEHALSAMDHPWCWIDDAGVYMRPEGDGWLCSPCDEAIDPPSDGPGSIGPASETAFALATGKLAHWLPALADVRWRGGWTGLRTFSPDRRPVMGSDPDIDGLWWAAGLGGFGVTCAMAIGEAVATWMHDGETDWLYRPSVSPGRHFLGRWPIRPDGDIANSILVDG